MKKHNSDAVCKGLKFDYLQKQFANKTKEMLISYTKIKDERITNYSDEGEDVESILITFLKDSLPGKFAIDSGYIINSNGDISLQQDIIIYDKLNTFIFKKSDGYVIVPIEFVLATIEVKSSLSKQKLIEANDNIKSVKCLPLATLFFDKKTNRGTRCKLPIRNIFSSIFAFTSKGSLKSICSNLKDDNLAIDSITLIDKGNLFYIEKEEDLGNGLGCYTFTSEPDHKNQTICIAEEKAKNFLSECSGLPLFNFFNGLLMHIETEIKKNVEIEISKYFSFPSNHNYILEKSP